MKTFVMHATRVRRGQCHRKVARDFERAKALSQIRHSIHHDVTLGLWVASLAPNITYVILDGVGMHDLIDKLTSFNN